MAEGMVGMEIENLSQTNYRIALIALPDLLYLGGSISGWVPTLTILRLIGKITYLALRDTLRQPSV